MSLVLDLGDHAIDYTSLAKTEHLSAIELEVRKLLDKLSGVRAETAYQVLLGMYMFIESDGHCATSVLLSTNMKFHYLSDHA